MNVSNTLLKHDERRDLWNGSRLAQRLNEVITCEKKGKENNKSSVRMFLLVHARGEGDSCQQQNKKVGKQSGIYCDIAVLAFPNANISFGA